MQQTVDTARVQTDRVADWRKETVKSQHAFEQQLVAAFNKLGVLLDMSELDTARARAEEEWAVPQSARAHSYHSVRSKVAASLTF